MAPRVMTEQPDRLRVASSARPVGVDRDKHVLRGYVVAQAGPFKSEGRGEFDELSLKGILEAWPARGLRSRFSHPTESSDGLGKFLGRARDPYLSTVAIDGPDGKPVSVPAVRADLHLSPTAFDANPNGNLGQYVLDLAAEDPAALSSSLVLRKKEEYRINEDGTEKMGDDGRPLPPLWRIEKLFATDIVDEGDAVDAVLGSELSPSNEPRWTRDYLTQGTALIDRLFAGQTRSVVKARLTAFLHRYLDRRYGSPSMSADLLGASLGGTLDGYINEAVSEERPREVILAEMAQVSGLEVAAVSAIVAGTSDEGVTIQVLTEWSKLLGCPLSELVFAAEEDGIDLTGSSEEPPAEEPPAEAPPAEPAPAPMSKSKPGVRRRRLELKEKATR